MPAVQNLIGRRSLYGLATTVAMSGEGARNFPAVFRVRIADFTFEPQKLLVPVGSRIEWTNADETPHSVVHLGDAPVFRSRALFYGERFTFQFERPGQYAYVCGMHRHMRGVVEVG